MYSHSHACHSFSIQNDVVECLEGSVKLLNPDASTESELPPYDLIKDQVARGTVLICINGNYGTVCDDTWDNQDASVVCNQLGYSPYGKFSHHC